MIISLIGLYVNGTQRNAVILKRFSTATLDVVLLSVVMPSVMAPGSCIIKLIKAVIYGFRNKP